MMMICQFSTTIVGSMSIPTETKKMAPKKSLMGLVTLSMFSRAMVSASMDPMMNAPSSADRSTLVANTTMPRHIPSDTTRSVSSLSQRFILFRKVGTRKMPQTSQTTMKNTSLPRLRSMSAPPKCLLTAIVPRNTITRMAKRSSKMSMPKTTSVKCFPLYLGSSKPFTMMVVDDRQSMHPRMRLLDCPHPIHVPKR